MVSQDTTSGMSNGTDKTPTTRFEEQPDYAHRWLPDSHGTQFTNGILTIAVNGLSLNRDWCDPNRVPHWALHNVVGLLQAAEEVRASPKNFNVLDCFPPNTNIREVDTASLAVGTQYLKKATKVDEVALPSPPNKRAKVTINPHRGRPLRLANVNRNSKTRSGGRGGRGFQRPKERLIEDEETGNRLCDVVISPSKELAEAEECGMLGRKRGTVYPKSVAAEGSQPRRQS